MRNLEKHIGSTSKNTMTLYQFIPSQSQEMVSLIKIVFSITRPKDLHQSTITKEIDVQNQSSPLDDQVIVKDEEKNAPILRRSKRQRKEKSFGPDFEIQLIKGTRDNLCANFSYVYRVEGDLLTQNMASQGIDFQKRPSMMNGIYHR